MSSFPQKNRRINKSLLLDNLTLKGGMMEILKIELFVPGKSKPETSTTISLNVIEHGKKLIPAKIKTILEREGIKISQLAELAEKKIPKGRLIEVENGKEKIVISVL